MSGIESRRLFGASQVGAIRATIEKPGGAVVSSRERIVVLVRWLRGSTPSTGCAARVPHDRVNWRSNFAFGTFARVAVQLVVQRLQAAAEHRRRPTLVPFAIVQRHFDQRALRLVQSRTERHVQACGLATSAGSHARWRHRQSHVEVEHSSARMKLRSTVFFSSRTLPAQRYVRSASANAGEKRLSVPLVRLSSARKWSASRGTSPARSRSGGMKNQRFLSQASRNCPFAETDRPSFSTTGLSVIPVIRTSTRLWRHPLS